MKKQFLLLSLSTALLTTIPLFAMNPADDDLLDHSKPVCSFPFEDMPKDLVMKASALSIVPEVSDFVTENDYKKNLFNLGQVSKKLYNTYLSEYVVGSKLAGEAKSDKVVRIIKQLLDGVPTNFQASKGGIGAFLFAEKYESMILGCRKVFHFDPGANSAIIWGRSPSHTKFDCIHEPYIEIFASSQSYGTSKFLLREDNKAWPFVGDVSKIAFEEYIFGGPQLKGNTGYATYTLYGKDKNDNEITVSYSFRKF